MTACLFLPYVLKILERNDRTIRGGLMTINLI